MKTTRRNFILTTAGGSLGALASGCANPDSTAKPTTKRTGGIALPVREIPLLTAADLVVCDACRFSA